MFFSSCNHKPGDRSRKRPVILNINEEIYQNTQPMDMILQFF